MEAGEEQLFQLLSETSAVGAQGSRPEEDLRSLWQKAVDLFAQLSRTKLSGDTLLLYSTMALRLERTPRGVIDQIERVSGHISSSSLTQDEKNVLSAYRYVAQYLTQPAETGIKPYWELLAAFYREQSALAVLEGISQLSKMMNAAELAGLPPEAFVSAFEESKIEGQPEIEQASWAALQDFVAALHRSVAMRARGWDSSDGG